ncbi:hypothetical protein EVAR_4514_1 [Eumeta japonica]|uniref:Uncharacterized protein n=1 Tax=Eumeta variegata TaxID=151549 RepID=A0A4C1SZB6_EUMVA|nr:hypothetical protein EVAR_4514_1 [Eumeta japonica]
MSFCFGRRTGLAGLGGFRRPRGHWHEPRLPGGRSAPRCNKPNTRIALSARCGVSLNWMPIASDAPGSGTAKAFG